VSWWRCREKTFARRSSERASSDARGTSDLEEGCQKEDSRGYGCELVYAIRRSGLRRLDGNLTSWVNDVLGLQMQVRRPFVLRIHDRPSGASGEDAYNV
jgi:hypothetical protein